MRSAKQERLWVYAILSPVILNVVGLAVFGTYYGLTAQRPELVAGVSPGQLAFVVYVFLFMVEWTFAISILLKLKRAGTSVSNLIAPQDGLRKFRPVPAVLVFAMLNATFGLYMARLWVSGGLQSYEDLEIWQRLFIVVFISLTAGFCEELIWRGCIITQLEARGRKAWSAVVLSAISFAPFHGLSLPDKLLVTFLFGIIAGLYFVRERNLVPLMVTHTILDLWPNGLLLFVS